MTLAIDFPHVWDVDGKPRGVRHRLTLDGETLHVADVGLDEHGAEVADNDLGSASMPFIEAVHILVNMTAEERAAFAARFPRPDR